MEQSNEDPIDPGHRRQLDFIGRIGHLPRHLLRGLPSPSGVDLTDPQLFRHSRRYLVQSGFAILGMLVVLLFVDSLAQAALAAGLGSSVVIVFIHPSSQAAKPRSLIGGHFLAVLVGSGVSLSLFTGPVNAVLQSFPPLRDVALALSVGLLIILMAVSGSEHPPAAGTVLGLSTRMWNLQTTEIIIGAVLLLALTGRLLHRYLRDLI